MDFPEKIQFVEIRKLVMLFIKHEINTPVHAKNILRLIANADRNKLVTDTEALEWYLGGVHVRSIKSLEPVVDLEGDGNYTVSDSACDFLKELALIIHYSATMTIETINNFIDTLIDNKVNMFIHAVTLSIFLDTRYLAWKHITKQYPMYVVHRLKFSAKTTLWYGKLVEYPQSKDGKRSIEETKLTTAGKELTLNLFKSLNEV